MGIRGAFRKRRPRTKVVTVEQAQAVFTSKEHNIAELIAQIEREHEELVKKDPIYEYLFLDRTSPNFKRDAKAVIEDHQKFMDKSFSQGGKYKERDGHGRAG